MNNFRIVVIDGTDPSADDGFGKPSGEVIDALESLSENLLESLNKRVRLSLANFLYSWGNPTEPVHVLAITQSVAQHVIAHLLAHGYIELTDKGVQQLAVGAPDNGNKPGSHLTAVPDYVPEDWVEDDEEVDEPELPFGTVYLNPEGPQPEDGM